MDEINQQKQERILFHLKMGDSFDGIVSLLRVQPCILARFFKEQGLLKGREKLTLSDKEELKELRRTRLREHPIMPVEYIHTITGIEITTMITFLQKEGIDHCPAPPIKVQHDESGNFNLRMDESLLGYALPKSPSESKTSGIEIIYTNDIKGMW